MIKTKEEFELMHPSNGGDLWNQYKLCKLAFNFYPDATKIEYHIGTGLWVDVVFSFQNGTSKTERIFDR